jgi:hypothetical protein
VNAVLSVPRPFYRFSHYWIPESRSCVAEGYPETGWNEQLRNVGGMDLFMSIAFRPWSTF